MNDSQDTQDGLDALRERVARAIEDAHHAEMMAFLRGEYAANTWRPEQYAKAVLTALGLDDFDAAVERAVPVVRHIMGEEWTANDCGASANLAYGVLQVALTPPEDEQPA